MKLFWLGGEVEDDKDGTMASASFRHAGEGRGIGGIEHDRVSDVGPSLRIAMTDCVIVLP
jgi:hypothetical protein